MCPHVHNGNVVEIALLFPLGCIHVSFYHHVHPSVPTSRPSLLSDLFLYIYKNLIGWCVIFLFFVRYSMHLPCVFAGVI